MLISDLLLNYLECLKLKRHTIRVSINSNRQHIYCYEISNSIKLSFWEFEKHIIINLKTTIYGQKQKGKVLNYLFNVFIDSDLLLLSKYCNKIIINSIINILKRELYYYIINHHMLDFLDEFYCYFNYCFSSQKLSRSRELIIQ